MKNPWDINSIYELQYFNCPSCDFKNSSKQELINHAHKIHPECVQFLSKITDNSFSDVLCPWNEIFITDIKIEETYSQEPIAVPSYKGVLTDINVEVLNELKIESCFNDLSENYIEIGNYSPKQRSVVKDLSISVIPMKTLNFYCNKCDKYFCSENTLKQHLNTHYNTNEQTDIKSHLKVNNDRGNCLEPLVSVEM